MDDKNIVIDVSDVTVRFNRASQQVNNLKEYVIKMVKKELMFQEFLALQNVSLQVRKGEAWGIVGTNGSGKSTLLKLICGILKPYKGSVSLSGTIAPLIELGAGFDGELTARENVLLNGTLLGYSESFMKEQFEEIIDFAEIGEFIDMPVRTYSSGMYSKLAFSITAILETDIMLIDEVLSVGDQKFKKKSYEKMKSLISNKDRTVVIVSHSIETLKQLCDTVMWMHEGQIKRIGDPDEVLDEYVAFMEKS